ncbi:MAG: O-antigen ligase family protein [Sedimentisphaerales bacterium]|nr:O-antigen ligase family protein [Sedimentisphaerales bacterium]
MFWDNSSENIESVQNKFDTIIEWILVGLLVFMPLLFGARNAWTEEVVVVLSGCIFICFLLKLIVYQQRIVWSWAYVLVGLFAAIAAFQLVPLPADWVGAVSPHTVALRTELLSDLPQTEETLESMTISLYPNGTKHDLRIVLSVAGVFFVVLNVFRRPNQIKRLLMVIALIGGFVSMIALAQDVFGNGLRYWFVPHPYYDNIETLSGPFINHNHYGQFMSLSIGAAFGWLFLTVHEKFSGKHLKPSEILDYLSSPSSRSLWLIIAIMGIGAATVFISLTRGGMVSMLIAAAFTTLLLVSRKSLAGQGWIMAVMALVAFACILYVGFDAVYDRFATLRNFEGYEFRWQIIKDIAAAFIHFPLLGTGLGTHSVVYPMYQNINTTLLFTHAENEYAQTLEETGLIGLMTLTIFAIFVWLGYFRNIRTSRRPICSAAYGLGFGLLAILIHSFSDYGQHIPANAFLSAIFCALLIGLAKQKSDATLTFKVITSSHKFRSLQIAALLGTCGVWVWIFIGSNSARIAEAHWKKALNIEKGLVNKNWQGTEGEYADLIFHASAASEHQPDNIEYQYWLNVYRWYLITKTDFYDAKDETNLEYSTALVRDIVSELNKAVILCPTYGPSYSLAGEIERFTLYSDAGAKKIRKGFQLAPCDPIACFIAGQLDVLEGKTEDSIMKFEKAVRGDGTLFKDVVNIYVNHLSRPHLAISAAGDNIDRLRHVAAVLEDMQYNDLSEQSRIKAMKLLEVKCSKPDASAGNFASLADIYRKQQVNEKAIEYYRRALELDYGQIHWRYAMAKLLAETERIPEALHEARICVRLRPQFEEAKRLVAELSVNPASFVGKQIN